MAIKSDKWIRRMAEQHGMIEPFASGQVREDQRGKAHLLWGIELRIRRSLQPRIQDFYQRLPATVDPKALMPKVLSMWSTTSVLFRPIPSPWPVQLSISRAMC